MQQALKVLYQDAKHICISKPVGCAIQGTPYSESGKNWRRLLKETQTAANLEKAPYVVHRLDANTSGVLLLAKTSTAARSLSQQFKRNTMRKTYLAIVDMTRMPSHWIRKAASPTEVNCKIAYTETGPRLVSTADPGTIDNKNASTILQILSSTGRYALLHLQPLTGRKHQLRLVCSEILQAPVIGDYKYGYTGKQVEGHLLHCFDLQFQTWQENGKMKRILVQAPLPDSFRRFAWTNVLDLSPVKKLSSVNQSDYQALGKHTLDSLINGSKPLAEEVEEMLQKVPSAGGYRCPPPLLPSSPSRERERCQTRDRKIS